MTNDVIVIRDLSIISAEINEIKVNATGMLRACEAYTKHSVFEIGKRLCEAKEAVGHGNFGEFLETVDYSASTANNLMRIYSEMGNDEAFNALSYSQLVALFALPVEERKALLPEVADKSSREIKKLVKDLEEAQAEAARLKEELEEIEGTQAEDSVLIVDLQKEKAELQKAVTAAESDHKKELEDAKEETRRIAKERDALKAEIEEHISKPLPTRELTEAELAKIGEEQRAILKVEFERQQAKEMLKSDPVLVELQIRLQQSLEGLVAVIALLNSWDNVEMRAKTSVLVVGKFDGLLSDLR